MELSLPPLRSWPPFAFGCAYRRAYPDPSVWEAERSPTVKMDKGSKGTPERGAGTLVMVSSWEKDRLLSVGRLALYLREVFACQGC